MPRASDAFYLRWKMSLSLALPIILTGCSGLRSSQTESLANEMSPEMEALFLQASPVDSYSRAVGHGSTTTGGSGAPQYIVENLNDSGPGSLREGLQNPAPLMVTFKPGLSGSISLNSSILLQSNKTIDGRGAKITISPANPNDPVTAFQIFDQSNIIIFNLNFDGKTSNWDVDSEGADAITIKNSSRIWIHRSSFSRWVDGGIDARPGTGGGISKNITISANRFEMIYQALNLTADGVTFAWNQCLKVRSRCIKIISGKAHSYNNFIDGWKGENIQHAKDGGNLLSEANIFGSGSSDSVKTEENGRVKMVGNYFRSKSSSRLTANQSVGSLKVHSIADASLLKCDKNAACWRRLESVLRGSSGYLSSSVPASASSTPAGASGTSRP